PGNWRPGGIPARRRRRTAHHSDLGAWHGRLWPAAPASRSTPPPSTPGKCPRSRRHFLHLTAVAAFGALLSACGPAEEENTPMDADEILSAAGFSAPTLETSVTEGMLEGAEAWSKVVTFSGPSEEVEAWIAENFDSGIQSEAYKDDMATAVERLGTGVQKQGDRLTEGVEGSVAFLVVVGQGENPEVH